MKRFLIKISILVIMILIADYSIGHILDYMVINIKVGGQGRDNYIANEAKEDILVFGSSRAVHHYNTPMLEDSLGISAYNCGDDGNGIILSYARLKMIKERHLPHIIILDVMPEFDLFKNDNHKYLGWLKAHYDREELHSIFTSIDKTERYKMISSLYKYNSRFIQNIIVYITGWSNDIGKKGFRPRKGKIDEMKIANTVEYPKIYEYDSLKLDYIDRFIELSKGSKLYIVVSPIWYGFDSKVFQPIEKLCNEKGIPFINMSNDPKYVHHDEFFKDGSHLNERGADEFTMDLVKWIKKSDI